MDMQNRVGSKFGGGQQTEADGAAGRKERLRQLALEQIDLAKDPYFMKNHLGTFECKLCLTLHTNEGSYLSHTQAKKHQTNLARRAKEEEDSLKASMVPTSKNRNSGGNYGPAKTVKIGRPGYAITKSVDSLGAKCLSFEVRYPDITTGIVPRYRFMSAFEQRVEAPDKRYQYLLFAAEPYETIAFKIPNQQIDKREGRFVTSFTDGKFTLTLFFVVEGQAALQD